MRARIAYLYDVLRPGTTWLLGALGLASLITGFALIEVIGLPLDSLVLAAVIAILLVSFEGGYRHNTSLRQSLVHAQRPRELPRFGPSGSMQFNADRPIATRTDLDQNHVQNRVVFISEVPLEGERVRNKVFADCDIVGPAVVALHDTTLELCTIGGLRSDPDTVFLEVPDEQLALVGPLVLEGCRVLRCRTFGVGFAGRKRDIAQMREVLERSLQT